MKERVKFVLEWERRWNAGEGRMNFAELCREFGISRQVGCGWLGRYREANHDVQSVAERSRRPLTSPSKVTDELDVSEFLCKLTSNEQTSFQENIELHEHACPGDLTSPSYFGVLNG